MHESALKSFSAFWEQPGDELNHLGVAERTLMRLKLVNGVKVEKNLLVSFSDETGPVVFTRSAEGHVEILAHGSKETSQFIANLQTNGAN